MTTTPLMLTHDQAAMLEAARAISSGMSWAALEILVDALHEVAALAGNPELRELARAVREPRSAAPSPPPRPAA